VSSLGSISVEGGNVTTGMRKVGGAGAGLRAAWSPPPLRAIVTDVQLIANVTATILLNNGDSSDFRMLPDNRDGTRSGIWKTAEDDFVGIDPGTVKLTLKAQNVALATNMEVEPFSCP
jgi:hypothetical protein